MFLWSIGGWLLGFGTALAGRRGVMLCTASVERAVHGHMREQEDFLAGKDEELRRTIAGIRREEEGHLSFADGGYDPECFWARQAERGVTWITDALIWATTRGESARLYRELARS